MNPFLRGVSQAGERECPEKGQVREKMSVDFVEKTH
jgi:hypothetical protein